ncbi:LLM class flavin-dependent oxidoreductase [Derxia gummosa]|uniref:LLM class flavin-dependent oxidoreductase n=1 Tax=Derxia gummosa DSM 723 TaxID=1121388 RepID=A0A8B6X5L9_9BURK|nr:LLM class flavin-dependent oxidoreductase [Derxia gummosa]
MTTPPPRIGYLCLCENPTAEAGRALIRQFVLVREADRMGFDDIWIGEQHFDDVWPTGASIALLGHLTGVTSKARIGSAALLAGLRDPVALAEDVATLDLLSKGRLNLGVGRGAPFGLVGKHFGLDAATVESRMFEALELMRKLHAETDVSWSGKHFSTTDLTLVPRPPKPIPVWIAAGGEANIIEAAKLGHGLMAGATWTVARLKKAVALYREHSGGADPQLIVPRFCMTAATREEAVAVAEPYLAALAERLGAAGVNADPAQSLALDPAALLEMSIVGSHEQVAARIKALNEELGGVYSVPLIPTSGQFDTVKHCLADLVDEVRKLLMDD